MTPEPEAQTYVPIYCSGAGEDLREYIESYIIERILIIRLRFGSCPWCGHEVNSSVTPPMTESVMTELSHCGFDNATRHR